ncbi:MAG: HXXEE domain-containing protein [Pyrinomonadaceae bacterium]
MASSPKLRREWTLWVVAASCALHVAEEYFTGWQGWAVETLGIVMPTARFLFMNAVLVLAAVVLASTGWKRPTLSLIIPAATLVNAIFFHILPTIVQRRVSPGVYTAALLYLPFSSWALVGAWRDGVPRRALFVALLLGTLMMTAVVLAAKWLSP